MVTAIPRRYLLRVQSPFSLLFLHQKTEHMSMLTVRRSDANYEYLSSIENVQDLISELFSQFTHSELAKNIADTNVAKDRLYKYWKQAGLEGSPREAISKYITEHAERYNLEFEDYDYDKPPMSYIDDDGNNVEGNSRAVRNNMLIHLIQSSLS